MLDHRTLQGRLTLVYAGALLLTLLAFAFAALAIATSSQQAEIDTRLSRIAATVSSLASWREGKFQQHAIDAARIAQLDGTIAESTIFAPDGSVLFSTSPAVPAAVREAALVRVPGASIGAARLAGEWRAWIDPIVRDGTIAGTAIVWHDGRPDRGFENRISSAFALAVPFFALVSLVVGALTARTGLRPLYAMVEVVSEVEAHDLSRRLGPAAGMPREIARLAVAFNRMLDRIEAAFARERQFTADASHELRAPLTVIRATAEYALETYREGAEYRRALQSIGLEANDLEVVVRDLLAAARADSALPASEEGCEIGAVAFDVIDELYPMARARKIAVRRQLTDDARVILDPQAMARVMRAILDNAIRHASEGGEVTVAIEARERDAVLVISDDGPGFSEQALQHATERFWRDDPSRQRGEGTGLGLAIAQGIVTTAGGRLELANGIAGGAIVRVTLPLAP